MQVQSLQPRKASPCAKTSYDVQIIKIDSLVFAQLTLLPNPQILCFTVPFNWPGTPKSDPSLGASTYNNSFTALCPELPGQRASTPHVIRSLDPSDSISQTAPRSVQPFSTAHGRESLMYINTRLMCGKKN